MLFTVKTDGWMPGKRPFSYPRILPILKLKYGVTRFTTEVIVDKDTLYEADGDDIHKVIGLSFGFPPNRNARMIGMRRVQGKDEIEFFFYVNHPSLENGRWWEKIGTLKLGNTPTYMEFGVSHIGAWVAHRYGGEFIKEFHSFARIIPCPIQETWPSFSYTIQPYGGGTKESWPKDPYTISVTIKEFYDKQESFFQRRRPFVV